MTDPGPQRQPASLRQLAAQTKQVRNEMTDFDEQFENCGNCKFGYDSDGGGIIECRRYAPKPVVLTEYHADREALDKSQYRVTFIHWPSVEETTWCGEWKPN